MENSYNYNPFKEINRRHGIKVPKLPHAKKLMTSEELIRKARLKHKDTREKFEEKERLGWRVIPGELTPEQKKKVAYLSTLENPSPAQKTELYHLRNR